MVKIGILDYAQVDEGQTTYEALASSVELAKHAEKLGFHRFWLAEHHDVPALSNSSPEMLMMKIADETQSIRIGSGGVMLPHYSPLKVAENFRTLEGFHKGRIDLGIGNNSGTPVVKAAMNELKEYFLPYDQAIKDTMYYLTNDVDDTHRFYPIVANPAVDSKPDLYLLSSGESSAKLAAELGIGYTFGMFPFFGSEKMLAGPQAASLYRDAFKPSDYLNKPKVIIAPFVAIAETKEEAEQLGKVLDVWLLGKEAFAEFKQFPSIETAKAYNLTDEDRERIHEQRKHFIVGDPEMVKEQTDDLIERFQADEVLFIPLLPSVQTRKRAYELLAKLYG